MGRFKNGRAVGNYFGVCPSESTSGDNRRLGPITKCGNPRLRKMMIQFALRIVHSRMPYVGLGRFEAVLRKEIGGSPGARKKAIVAVARRLAVDLWRIRLGRKTAQELGLQLAIA